VIENRLIVCLASSWDLDPTSKHHVMRILSRRNDVIWVNYHGSRRPQLAGGDARRSWGHLRRVFQGLRPINERMVQLTPLVLPGVRSGWATACNRVLLTQQLRRALAFRRRHRRQPVQLWTFAPDTGFLAGQLGEECLVYYCVDEFSQFEGFDQCAVAAAERRLLKAADVVLTSSQRLFESKSPLHPRVHLVRHGVQHAHFARALARDLPAPAPIHHVPHPIAGFMGVLHHWIDVELLAETARRRPEISLVIVGECLVDVAALRRLPNVHFTGRQPYESLPAYCAAFDFGVIPFKRSPMTENVNPIKLREYLSAGLPVVSTGLPEVRRFDGDVLIAEGAAAFAAAFDTAVTLNDLESRRRRSAALADQDWEQVIERLDDLVSAALVDRIPPPGKEPAPRPGSAWTAVPNAVCTADASNW
jgi:glycosyltransferase involved in cell wall biosynthesis